MFYSQTDNLKLRNLNLNIDSVNYGDGSKVAYLENAIIHNLLYYSTAPIIEKD